MSTFSTLGLIGLLSLGYYPSSNSLVPLLSSSLRKKLQEAIALRSPNVAAWESESTDCYRVFNGAVRAMIAMIYRDGIDFTAINTRRLKVFQV
jgi:hypothetical protein